MVRRLRRREKTKELDAAKTEAALERGRLQKSLSDMGDELKVLRGELREAHEAKKRVEEKREAELKESALQAQKTQEQIQEECVRDLETAADEYESKVKTVQAAALEDVNSLKREIEALESSWKASSKAAEALMEEVERMQAEGREKDIVIAGLEEVKCDGTEEVVHE